MEPLIKNNAVMLVDKVTPKLRDVRKGEVVVLRSLHDEDEFICKRVAHVWGDSFKLEDREVVVPEKFLWLEGDNANFSFDSRHYGPMSDYLVVGIVRGSIYPEFKLINSKTF